MTVSPTASAALRLLPDEKLDTLVEKHRLLALRHRTALQAYGTAKPVACQARGKSSWSKRDARDT